MGAAVIAWVFPGQGSQQPGMGAAAAAESKAARATFDEAEAVLGIPLGELCFGGDDDALRATEIAQPALLCCSIALLRAYRDRLAPPAFTAGHSLGEYTALVAAGALEFATALRLVRRRGELMRDCAAATPGAMAALLRLDEATVAKLCDEAPGVVVPANFNAPGQIVVSGQQAAVEAVCAAAEQARGRVLRLNVSGPFHSPLMQPAAEAMAAELAAAPIADARVPVVQNVSAEPTRDAATLRANLAAQITGAVRWTESVQRMRDEGVTHLLEIGPGGVLTGLTKRIDKALSGHALADPASAAALAQWQASEVTGV